VQYASHDYRAVLSAAGITGSMSRKADCYDNAPMESFFHTLKTELVHHRQYKTRGEAQRDIFAFIEGFYNPRRRHSWLGYLSPINYERRHEEQAVDPSAHHPAAVLGAVKVRPGDVGACVDAGATADLDRPCARQRPRRAGRDGGTGSAGAEQRNSTKKEDTMTSHQIP
jgi:hypothetical protein